MDEYADRIEIEVRKEDYAEKGRYAGMGGGPACFWPDENPLVILCC